MKLIYIANTRMPTGRAHGWQIMKMCESFASCGADVTLVLPQRKNPEFQGVDPFKYYDVAANFKIIRLPCVDLITPTWRLPGWCGIILGVMQNGLYNREIRRFLKPIKDAVIFTREHRLLYLLKNLSNKKVYEIHDFPESNLNFYKKLFKTIDKVVVTNKWKKENLEVKFGISQDKILVAPNAVDVDKFALGLSKEHARMRLGLPTGEKIIMYVGGLAEWKGVYVLGDAAKYIGLPCRIYFVGGSTKERAQFKKYLDNIGASEKITLKDAVPHKDVPQWLAAADVLVMPGTAKDTNAMYYTSPLKLFEYLASGRRVVLTDLQSQREAAYEALGDVAQSLDFVPPDDPKALANSLERAIKECGKWDTPAIIDKLKSLTWTHRAQKILLWLQQ